MKAITTIREMLTGNSFFVRTNQGAYLWDTEFDKANEPKQINRFLSDLEECTNSKPHSKYDFGDFRFEEKADRKFGVIDGQQRLTTIIIFLSALFTRLKQIRVLKESEQETFEDLIKRKSTYRVATVEYNNQLFKEYVIDQIKKDKKGIETESAKRTVMLLTFLQKRLRIKMRGIYCECFELLRRVLVQPLNEVMDYVWKIGAYENPE